MTSNYKITVVVSLDYASEDANEDAADSLKEEIKQMVMDSLDYNLEDFVAITCEKERA